MRIVRIYTAVLLLCFGVKGYSQIEFPKMEGWELQGEIDAYDPSNLWGIINGAADKYLKYKFENLYFGIYQSEKNDEINVYAYKHKDLNNTFGIYSQEKPDNATLNHIGAEGYASGAAVNFFKGSYYVKMYSNNQSLTDEISQLAKLFAANINDDAAYPYSLLILPEKNKIEGTQTYISSNFLGLGFLHSAFIADYQQEDSKYTVFVIELATEEDCKKMLNDYLAFTKQDLEIMQGNVLVMQDKYNGQVPLVWKGNYIVGISGEPGQQISDEVLNSVKSKL